MSQFFIVKNHSILHRHVILMSHWIALHVHLKNKLWKQKSAIIEGITHTCIDTAVILENKVYGNQKVP